MTYTKNFCSFVSIMEPYQNPHLTYNTFANFLGQDQQPPQKYHPAQLLP